MLTKEELDSWNELFPDCKIRENDLANPTDAFLTRALIAYLRIYGYKVPQATLLEGSENSREKTQILLKLTRHIDKILKTTDKSYSFLYYDLVRPTPKKTSHTLGVLLNYLYYYNMYKTDVFAMGNERIKQRQELQAQIASCKEENKENKSRAEKAEAELIALSAKVSTMKAALEVQNEELTKRKVDVQNTKKAIEELCVKLDELKVRRRSLKTHIVPDTEAQALQSQISTLKQKLEDNKSLEVTTANALQAHQDQINILQEVHKRIEEANQIVPSKLEERYRMNRNELQEKDAEIAAMQKKKQHLLEMIEKQESALKSFEERLLLKTTQAEEEQHAKEQLVKSAERDNAAHFEELRRLQDRDQNLDCAYAEEKDICTYLQDGISQLMTSID